MNETISIIIPCYNEETVIRETLSMVHNQTYKNIEVIVVDDGSVDQTKEIVKDIKLSYPNTHYYYQSNSGVSSARNLGIKKSTGQYIMFLDADDAYTASNAIERMVIKINKTESDVVYCGYIINDGKKIKKRKSRFTTEHVLEKYLLGYIQSNTDCWLISKELISEHNIEFKNHLDIGEDIYFFSTVLSSTKNITFVKDYLLIYNYDSNQGLGAIKYEKMDRDALFIYEMLEDHLITSNQNIKSILLDYKLPANLVNTFLFLLKNNYSETLVKKYFNRYGDLMFLKPSVYYGEKTLKLEIKKIILKYIYNKQK